MLAKLGLIQLPVPILALLAKLELIQIQVPILALNVKMGFILKKVIANVLNALQGNIITKENVIIAKLDITLQEGLINVNNAQLVLILIKQDPHV